MQKKNSIEKRPSPFKRFRAWLNQGDGWWTQDIGVLFTRLLMWLSAPEGETRAPLPPPKPAEPATPPPPVVTPETPQATEPIKFFERLKSGVQKSRAWLTDDLFSSGKQIDAELLEELETRLLTADVGMDATRQIIDNLTDKLSRSELKDAEALWPALRAELLGLLTPCQQTFTVEKRADSGRDRPFVLLMVGVNGVGKTTTIGKLARKYLDDGLSVMLAAGDTFRAAAVEQLQVWGERNDVPVIAQQPGADPAAVIFDALESAQSKNVDIVIADTAGRLHTADNLMAELAKIRRVIQRFDETAPHEVMLVVDAVTGQNAVNQAKQFQETAGVSGITVTKLDGTAKGGVVFAIAKQLGIPIRFIGVGEQAADLGEFVPEDFVDALLTH